jgi:hypothetical protein
MSEQRPETEEQPIERGAAEEASGAPLTPTEDKARRTPPSTPEPATDQADPGQ